MIPFDEAVSQLRECFDVPGDALERAESILELQHSALAADPPLRALPEAAAVATLARLRSGEPIIPRLRWPIEPSRVTRLLRVLGGSVLEGAGLEEAAAPLVESALPAAQADDGAGVLKAAERLGLPADASAALLREALKPEMLRLSLPFAPLIGHAPRGARCPACGDSAHAGTQDRHACCRWCGTLWRWDGKTCPSCGKLELRGKAVERFVRGATMMQCGACGDAVALFPVSPDALLLSMLAVLVSPLDLALRIGAEARPTAGFTVF